MLGKKVLMSNHSTCFLMFWLFPCLALMAQHENHFDFSDSTNIIAAVVGYQVEQKLGSNVTVKAFSNDLSVRSGRELAVLFYVVCPTNYAGKYFMISNEGEYARTDKLYQLGKLYYFEFSINGYNVIQPRNLFVIPPNNLIPLYIDHLVGYRYFLSNKEAKGYLEELNIEQQQEESNLIHAQLQMDAAEKPSKTTIMSEKIKMPYYKWFDQVKNIEMRLRTIHAKREDTLKQIEKRR